jgi:hypothetical protein
VAELAPWRFTGFPIEPKGDRSSLYFSMPQVQKRNYRQEKKRAAKELFSALKDPRVVIMSDWLKVRSCPSTLVTNKTASSNSCNVWKLLLLTF